MGLSRFADVRLFPFHATNTGLPELERGRWTDVISGSASSNQNVSSNGGAGSSSIVDRPRERTAGILLSEPHFIAVGHHPSYGMHMLKAETPMSWRSLQHMVCTCPCMALA